MGMCILATPQLRRHVCVVDGVFVEVAGELHLTPLELIDHIVAPWCYHRARTDIDILGVLSPKWG